jgi:hypothetical protein
MWNEDEDEDEDNGPVNTKRALRGDDMPTEAFETVRSTSEHLSVLRFLPRFLL